MKTYIFHREDVFYLIELRDDEDAIKNAECNPGTTKVTNTDGEVIWSAISNKLKKA